MLEEPSTEHSISRQPMHALELVQTGGEVQKGVTHCSSLWDWIQGSSALVGQVAALWFVLWPPFW